MKKVYVVSVLLISICLIIGISLNKEEKQKYSVTMPELKALGEEGAYGEYSIEEEYLKYIESDTTVEKFIENAELEKIEVKVYDRENKEKGKEELVATGNKAQLTGKDMTKTYTIIVAGDVNGDGQSNIRDILSINKYRLGKAELTKEQLKAGDVDYNGTVDLRDLLKINKYRLEKIETLLPEEIHVTGIALSQEEIEINLEDSYRVDANVYPTNATNQNIIWTSSNENVATVEAGTIIGKTGGEAEITAKTEDGGYEAKLKVKVSIEAKEIQINTEKIEIEEGNQYKLEIRVLPEDATDVKIEYVSSDEEVALINEEGVITGLREGNSTILVQTNNGLTAECEVTVKKASGEIIQVEEIEITQKEIEINKEETVQLEAKVMPENATNKGITWTSSNEEIVIVDSYGKVTGKNAGEAEVTAKTIDGSEKEATVRVKVTDEIKEVPVTQILVDEKNIVLNKDESKEIEATIMPENATNKALEWISNNSAIAEVDSNGKIIAKDVGETQIIVKATDGSNVTETINVKVITQVETITLNKTQEVLDISNNSTTKLEATVITSSEEKRVTWNSSNTTIVTVDQAGNVKGLANGTALITATTVNGKTATCKVTVQTSPTGLALNKTTETLDLSGTKTEQLVSTITPSTANINNAVTWQSSNTKIATVDNSGKVTGIANGTVTITATTANGKTAICKVTIQTSPSGVTLNKTSATLDMSGTKTVQLTSTITPSTVNTNNSVTWKSGNTKIATVDNSGKVTGLANGVATITVTTANGKTATCKITVQTSPTGITLSKTTVKLDLLETNTVTLKATLNPTTANINNTLTWTSSDTKIATVSSAGKVTVLKEGTATITVKTANGKTATCKITALKPSVQYEVHVQGDGWMQAVSDGQTAGTTGESKRMEAIKIKINNYENLNVVYRAYMQGTGWGDWTQNGAIAGTVNESKRLEAIQIKLSGTNASKYDIYYRAYTQGFGWLGWAKNATTAGTLELSYRMEAIQIKIVKKGEEVKSSIENTYINGKCVPIYSGNTNSSSTFTVPVSSESVYKNGQGMTRVKATDGKNYTVAAVVQANNQNTYMFILNDSGTVVARVRDFCFGHANGMTADDKYIYISAEGKIQVLKMAYVKDAISKYSSNGKNVITSGFTSKYLVKSDGYPHGEKAASIAYDKTRDKLYGSTKSGIREICRDSNGNIELDSSGTIKYSGLLRYPIVKEQLSNVGNNAGIAIVGNYLLAGRYTDPPFGGIAYNTIHIYKCSFNSSGKISNLSYTGTYIINGGNMQRGEIEDLSVIDNNNISVYYNSWAWGTGNNYVYKLSLSKFNLK